MTKARRLRDNRERGTKRKLWYRVYRSRMNAGLELCRWEDCFEDGTTMDHLRPQMVGTRRNFDNATIMCEYHNKLKGASYFSELCSLAEEERRASPSEQWVVIAQAEVQAYMEDAVRTYLATQVG